MSMTEKALMHKLMLAFTKAGARVFRNHVGLAFQGKPVRFAVPTKVEMQPGDILIRQARTVRAGLITGSSDLVGWRSMLITAEMVGSRLAAFVACEVKTEQGTLEPEQRRFLDTVEQAGGIAIEARDIDSAVLQLTAKGKSDGNEKQSG